MLRDLAGNFGQLVDEFEALNASGLDLGGTGDAALTQAIEHFIDYSRSQLGELSRQFSELHTVLIAAATGYEQVDAHVATEAGSSTGPS